MMRSFFLLAVMASLFSCNGNTETDLEKEFSKGKWIDLTYAFSGQTLYWPNNPTGFKLDTQFNGITPAGFYYSSNAYSAPEHGGTHLDAPVHFAKGAKTSDALPIDQLQGNAVVIDVSVKAASNRDYLISVNDVEEWEKKNGAITDGAVILFRTGYGKYYPDALKYFGTDMKGSDAIPLLHFPGIDPALASWLLKNRKIKAVGLDTPSIDFGQSKDFLTHRTLMAENIPAFENVANLDQLPEKGAYVIALPMKIKGGTGGPLRMIAWVRGRH